MTTLINLLPDLRQAKLRERRRRQLATGVSVTIWIACGAVIGLMMVISAGQKLTMANVTKSIGEKEQTLQGVTGLVEALTANQHLASLPGLYDKRIFLTKFFNAYSEADPLTISLNSMQIDSQNLLTVMGTAPSYADVAKLARALTASNVRVGTGASESNMPYFSNVNIISVENSDRTGVTFSITASVMSGVTSAAK